MAWGKAPTMANKSADVKQATLVPEAGAGARTGDPFAGIAYLERPTTCAGGGPAGRLLPIRKHARLGVRRALPRSRAPLWRGGAAAMALTGRLADCPILDPCLYQF